MCVAHQQEDGSVPQLAGMSERAVRRWILAQNQQVIGLFPADMF
jgi:hypothetical protein